MKTLLQKAKDYELQKKVIRSFKKEENEMNRQIRLGWERGRSIGRLEGYGVCVIFCAIVAVISFIK